MSGSKESPMSMNLTSAALPEFMTAKPSAKDMNGSTLKKLVSTLSILTFQSSPPALNPGLDISPGIEGTIPPLSYTATSSSVTTTMKDSDPSTQNMNILPKRKVSDTSDINSEPVRRRALPYGLVKKFSISVTP